MLGRSDTPADREVLNNLLTSWRLKLGYFSIFAALPTILASQSVEARSEDVETPTTNSLDRAARFAAKSKECRAKPDFLRRQSEFRLPHQLGGLDLVKAFTGDDDCPGRPIPGGSYTAAAPYVDTGNTTGANDTVSRVNPYYYCYPGSYYETTANGPDLVYSFTLTGRGPNPRIDVSTTSATYRPMIYVLEDSNFSGGGCPGGTGNQFVCPRGWRFASSPGGSVALDRNVLRYLPLNTPLHLFIDSRIAGPNDSGPYTLRMQDLSIAPAPPLGVQKRNDFDGDGRADLSVFRPSNRTWYLNLSSGGSRIFQFGLATDKIAPMNLRNGFGTRVAVFRDGVWWTDYDQYYTSLVQFGAPNDIPVPADYTGDGNDDLAVYRNGTWIIHPSIGSERIVYFGLAGDKPVPADYDGDARVDQAVYRNGVWHVNRSTQGYAIIQFGLATDTPVVGDYDGDGRTDLAVYRNGVWYLQQSTDGLAVFQFGLAGDIPVPDDYDGDGKTDLAVYRNGTWYLLQSTSGLAIQQFGLAGDKPVPAAFIP